MAKIERPEITKKPIMVLSMNQVRLLFQMQETPEERVALELTLDHGWRQVEGRWVLSDDVAEISDDTILCLGKEREEYTPVLPRT